MNKLLSLAAAMLVALAFGGPAVAFHPEPDRYEVGKVQPFVGLVCKTQAPATHIFATWLNAGVRDARKVFKVYNAANECFSARTFEAYFIEKLDSMDAEDYRGIMQVVLLFSISPTKENERRDYLVTWINLPPEA